MSAAPRDDSVGDDADKARAHAQMLLHLRCSYPSCTADAPSTPAAARRQHRFRAATHAASAVVAPRAPRQRIIRLIAQKNPLPSSLMASADEAARAAATAELVALFMGVEEEGGRIYDDERCTPKGAALLAALPRLLEAGLADVNVRLDHMTPLLLVRVRVRAPRRGGVCCRMCSVSACALNTDAYVLARPQAAHYNIELTDANQRDNMDDVRQGGTDEAVDVVRTLLRFPGTDANVRIGSTSAGLPYSTLPMSYPEGATALHMAAQASLHEAALLEALLAGGAEVDARDAVGATPLLYAASYSLHLTRCLLDAGASPLAADDGGLCALLQAAVCETAVAALRSPSHVPDTWAMNIIRTDAPLRARRKRPGWRTDGHWHFAEHEVDMAPLMTALMLTRIATPTGGYAPDAPLRAAAHMAAEVHGGDAAVTRMLRLAHAGVPLTWSRGTAHAFPDAFRAVVRALLLCRARVRECGLHRLDDACFDAVLARLARVTVWPTLRCVAGGLTPWREDAAAKAVQEGRVEEVSVFDFSTQSTS
jgi:hypothetical protein